MSRGLPIRRQSLVFAPLVEMYGHLTLGIYKASEVWDPSKNFRGLSTLSHVDCIHFAQCCNRDSYMASIRPIPTHDPSLQQYDEISCVLYAKSSSIA